LRATVRIHPAAIVLGLIAAASIGGFWGVLLAVPVMAAVKIIVGHYWRTRVLGESWEEASEALIDDDPAPDTFITRLLDADDESSES
jgi:predicted PurR-regulated permease PerM